ncbi:hypothetical protein K9L67_02080 [Candidatus Woesearchaeota archaeon]|nr:hypothetical protein [Candidatus Woesearchaeota archaeon]MCF7900992.1 hypothetical protein [Candidatus Woesearchaeota archaeon]MCF8013292.1 hypothetical protein [Candidatus Woesearchaeota archaeon]
MDLEALEDLGLTKAEIKVFITLLDLGSSKAGSIVERSGLQNAVVHRTFHSLVEKGLLTYVYDGKSKIYQVIEPKELLNFLEDKKDRLNKLLPELEARKLKKLDEPKVAMYRGSKGVKELLLKLISKKNVFYYSYGGPFQAHDLFGDFFWKNFHRRRIENHIVAKIIFNNSLKWWADELNKQKFTKVNVFDSNYEECSETIISGEYVAIIIYLDKPFGFLISSKDVSNSYKNFFNYLWLASADMDRSKK